MKRIIACLLLLSLGLSLCGCDLWMDGSYYSVTPHRAENYGQENSSTEVNTYQDLRDELIRMVRDVNGSGVIYTTGIKQEELERYIPQAIEYAMEDDPIGNYAVNEITYEIGTSSGRTAIAVSITYDHSRSEILRIKKTEGMDEAMAVIMAALEDCQPAVVVMVSNYAQADLLQLVQDHVDQHPDVCMEMPQVSAATYPEWGKERVLELTFTYQTSREALRTMQNYVGPVFQAADLNVRGEEEESVKFSRMYSFLMERTDYQVETSITPAYSLLRHGVGDSRAFAQVYAAMCRRAGLHCQTVSGTRSGEPWMWNIICEDGVYYHVDLLYSNNFGRLYKLADYEMQNYVWDYSAYPASGTEAG